MSNATTKQISFYNSILDQIAKLAPSKFSPESISAARDTFPARTTIDASESITRAKLTVERLKAAASAKVVVVVVVKPVSVASGHYALTIEGVVKFYRVNAVTEGKWAGYTFVDAQASDEFHKVGREASARVLAAIAVDPIAALKLYGHSLGRCGVCNRTLTDEASRAAGIGPICQSKFGR